MLNTCLYCGRIDNINTKIIGGQTILENCSECEHEILYLLQITEAPIRQDLLKRAKTLNLPLIRYSDRYSTMELQKIITKMEALAEEIEIDRTCYLE